MLPKKILFKIGVHANRSGLIWAKFPAISKRCQSVSPSTTCCSALRGSFLFSASCICSHGRLLSDKKPVSRVILLYFAVNVANESQLSKRSRLLYRCFDLESRDGARYLRKAICKAICNSLYFIPLYSLRQHFSLWRSLVLHSGFNGSNHAVRHLATA